MVDSVSKEKRSKMMGGIKSKNTKPEKAVRSLLHEMGFRFRLHNKELPGKPDIVLPKYKSVIFVHGCFWHRHKNCKYAYMPKSRIDFWNKKFQSNIERDQRVSILIRKSGWLQLIIWECETKDTHKLGQILRSFLSP